MNAIIEKETGTENQTALEKPGASSLAIKRATYIPSRYNVKVQDETGQWIVYNSFTGTVGAIPKDKEEFLLPLLRGETDSTSTEAEQFIRNGFLVPQGTDELKRVELMKQERQSARLLNLILMPTEECNFRCVYCYENFARGAMRPNVREGVKNLAAQTIPHIEKLIVSWFGGEPMEEMGIIEELSHSMVEACRANGVSYQSSMTTNGWHLTPENLERLLACEVRKIQVTLDGCESDHDAARKAKNGGKTFAKIWDNLRASRGVKGDFNMVVRVNFNPRSMKGHEQLLSDLAREFSGDGRFSVFFRPQGYWGGSNDGNFEICERKEGELEIFESARKAVRQGLRLSALKPAISPHGSVCYAANRFSFVVGSDGTLYKCTVALDKDINKVGRLLPDGRMELNKDRFALWVTSDDTGDTVCGRCFFRPACQGAACPLERIENGERPCPTEKKHIRRALIALWEEFKTLGPLASDGTAQIGSQD